MPETGVRESGAMTGMAKQPKNAEGDIIYRPAGAADIPDVARVYREALSGLNRRHGYEYRSVKTRPVNPFYAFTLEHESEQFQVAESGGVVVGAAISWTRPPLWFLSHLFIEPRFQGIGIGRALLTRVLVSAKRSDIRVRGVMTALFNTVSTGLYSDFNMKSRETMWFMTGKARAIRAEIGRSDDAGRYEKLSGTDDVVRTLSGIDEKVLGYSRELHHRYFFGLPEVECYGIFKEDEATGYVYLWPDGHIGPAAAKHIAALYKTLPFALLRAAERSGTVSVIAPVSGIGVMKLLLAAGLSADYPYCFMSTKMLTRNRGRYLFHSPGMM